jgi:hypothetical protein
MNRSWRGGTSTALLALPLLACLSLLAGCELLYFAGAERNKTTAVYTFPKGQKVLVLTELRDGVSAPPAFTTNLADSIASRFWQLKVVDATPVSQDRLIALQQADPTAYAKMGVADIARETGADVVLRVYITQLQAPATADGTVAEGFGQAYIKLVSKSGDRLWPGDVNGQQIPAHVDLALLSDRSSNDIIKKLSTQLSDGIVKLFHSHEEIEDHSLAH